MRATARTECFRLTRAAFERVLKNFPSQADIIKKVAEDRRQRIMGGPSSGRTSPKRSAESPKQENKKDQ